MKFIYVAILVLLAGCNSDANSRLACHQAVVDVVGTQDVTPITDVGFKFVARDKDGNVLYLETLDFNSPKVTKQVVLFKGK